MIHGELLTDMQADEMVNECHPHYETSKDGTRIGKIFEEQYVSMLMDGGV